MLNKKIMILTIIFVSLLTVSAISAADNATDDVVSVEEINEEIAGDINEMAIASDDTIVNEETLAFEEISDDALAICENNEDVLNIDQQNDEDTIIAKDDANDKSTLTVKNADEDILGIDKISVKVNFYKQTGIHFNDKKIYVKVTDLNGKSINLKNGLLYLNVYNYKTNKYIDFIAPELNSKGIAIIDWAVDGVGIGVFKIKTDCVAIDDDYLYEIVKNPKDEVKVTVQKTKATITTKALTVPKKSKKNFKIKVTDQRKKAISGARLKIDVYTGNKAKTYYMNTNSKGIVNFNKVSKLSKGKHKVKISLPHKNSKGNEIYNNLGMTAKSVATYITVCKATASKKVIAIKAKKMSAKYKKSTLFKVTVKNKKSGKLLKGVKVIMKVYTGKKFKKIVHKTNKKGKTGFNTKSLSKGKHKVVVIVKANSKYKKAVKKSSVTIKGKTNKNKNSNSKNKNKKSSTNKGKLRTKLTIKECYRTGNIGEIFIKVSLKDSKGRPLANKEISIDTVAYLGPMSQPTYNTATTDSKGIAQGYVTSMLGGIATYDVTVKFSGDKSHKSSSASTYLD